MHRNMNLKDIVLDKLGLSCAKLRANLAWLGLAWLGFGLVMYRFALFDLFTYKNSISKKLAI